MQVIGRGREGGGGGGGGGRLEGLEPQYPRSTKVGQVQQLNNLLPWHLFCVSQNT